MSLRVLLIHNPVAGTRRRRRLRKLLRHLERAGHQVRIRITKKRSDAREHARLAEGFDVIVAAGGDGTVNEVVDGLMVKPAKEPLPKVAFLALGTANVLAWELKLPKRPAALARVIEAGATVTVHPGIVNSRRFILMASAGLDARAVAAVKSLVKRWFGGVAYVFAAINVLTLAPPQLTVEIDGRPFSASTVIVTRARCYGGPFTLTPAAGLTEPELQVVMLKGYGFGAALRYGWALARGKLDALDDVTVMAAKAVHILAEGDEPVQIDGDDAAALPAVITIDDRAVELVAPARGTGKTG